MRLAILDIGSHAAQLVVVEGSARGPLRPVRAIKRPLRLEGYIECDGTIGGAGVRRTVNGVTRVLAEARRCDIDGFYAFVTAAIRDAPNRDDVLDRIDGAVGIRPQFLSGAQEAHLTYLAVRSWSGRQAGPLLSLDIGGGSTELAFGSDAEPSLTLSLPLGTRLLTRGFLIGDPPSLPERAGLRRHIRACLAEVRDPLLREGGPRRVIGSSKTFKQLARIAGAGPQRHRPWAQRPLSRDSVRATVGRLACLSARERTRLRGVAPSRARQLLAGAMIAEATMTEFGIDQLEVSPWALREGVALHHISHLSDPAVTVPLTPLRFPTQREPIATTRLRT
ncbi:Ppx/GppA phosphatase family protein [Nocardia bovistercoris]|uniref:Ppx/GppA phosphatase N-terminal domain-containing protein n=1 Tax=Nocardia bovistercoris TaxID=2785916 RepID=A0A931I8H6_9NOCA|nr:hypothetical protein [Nocardia bovistercoris]MBH0776804.1 hypothetical protein [Nocardia bovistercoris]